MPAASFDAEGDLLATDREILQLNLRQETFGLRALAMINFGEEVLLLQLQLQACRALQDMCYVEVLQNTFWQETADKSEVRILQGKSVCGELYARKAALFFTAPQVFGLIQFYLLTLLHMPTKQETGCGYFIRFSFRTLPLS